MEKILHELINYTSDNYVISRYLYCHHNTEDKINNGIAEFLFHKPFDTYTLDHFLEYRSHHFKIINKNL